MKQLRQALERRNLNCEPDVLFGISGVYGDLSGPRREMDWSRSLLTKQEGLEWHLGLQFLIEANAHAVGQGFQLQISGRESISPGSIC